MKKSHFTSVLEKDESFKWGTFHQDLSYHSNEMTFEKSDRATLSPCRSG